MSALGEEVRHVQNPALGALLEWRFVVGHFSAGSDASGCPLPLLFLVLPLLFQEDTLANVVGTQRRSGLRAFGAKFAQPVRGDSDILLALHDRAMALRSLSLESLRVAVGSHLLTVDVQTGVAFELSKAFPLAGVPESVRDLARGAEKLGHWCGLLTLVEISSILRLRF